MEKSSESKEFGPKSLKRSKRVSLHLGQMVCFICNKPATNLCAARVMHASKTAADKQHVKETSEKINTIVIGLGNKPILAKLSSGDIVSNELNYQKSCYKDLAKKYNQKSLAESNWEVSLRNEINEFWKAVCFNKAIMHIRETYVRGIDFEASPLINGLTLISTMRWDLPLISDVSDLSWLHWHVTLFYLNHRFEVAATVRGKLVLSPNVKNVG